VFLTAQDMNTNRSSNFHSSSQRSLITSWPNCNWCTQQDLTVQERDSVLFLFWRAFVYTT